jgi:phenylacetate-CoA ligase
MHIQSDHFYPEVINPETGNVLDDGEEGELVLTTLTKKALPLFRYRTGDITALHHGSCGCGRTTVRMDHVAGRTDDMITVRGTNVFPSQIETVIYDIDELRSEYRIDVRREKSLDTIEITVEIGSPEDADREKIRKQLTERLKDELQLTPDEVRFVDPMTIERTEVGKVKRLHDHRSLS